MAIGIIIPKVSDTNIIIPNETYYEFLTSGTWICKKTGTYKIELIGGGASGYSGYNDEYYSQNRRYGRSGNSGNINSIELTIQSGISATITIGTGGLITTATVTKAGYQPAGTTSIYYNRYYNGSNKGLDSSISINGSTYTAIGGPGGSGHIKTDSIPEHDEKRNSIYPQYGYGGRGGDLPTTGYSNPEKGQPGGNGYCRITLLAR